MSVVFATPQAAEEAFYDAFQRGDLAAGDRNLNIEQRLLGAVPQVELLDRQHDVVLEHGFVHDGFDILLFKHAVASIRPYGSAEG